MHSQVLSKKYYFVLKNLYIFILFLVIMIYIIENLLRHIWANEEAGYLGTKKYVNEKTGRPGNDAVWKWVIG